MGVVGEDGSGPSLVEEAGWKAEVVEDGRRLMLYDFLCVYYLRVKIYDLRYRSYGLSLKIEVKYGRPLCVPIFLFTFFYLALNFELSGVTLVKLWNYKKTFEVL